MGAWEFGIDVGGTFTDCVARAPDGSVRTWKVLSTGAVRGAVGSVETKNSFRDAARCGDPADAWVGYRVTLYSASMITRLVTAFDPERGVLETDAGFDAVPGTLYDLTC